MQGQHPQSGCNCGMCQMHRNFFLRWILGLIILAMVFWVGVKIGEFKAGYFEYQNYPMMMNSYSPGMMTRHSYGGSGMMQTGSGGMDGMGNMDMGTAPATSTGK